MGGAAAPGASHFAADRRRALQGQSGWVSFILCLLLFLSYLLEGRPRPQWQNFCCCSVRVLGRTVRAVNS